MRPGPKKTPTALDLAREDMNDDLVSLLKQARNKARGKAGAR